MPTPTPARPPQHPMLQWLRWAHLPADRQAPVHRCAELADMVIAQTQPSAEQSATLRHIVEAKDAAVACWGSASLANALTGAQLDRLGFAVEHLPAALRAVTEPFREAVQAVSPHLAPGLLRDQVLASLFAAKNAAGRARLLLMEAHG